jgi:hypothetical protein
MCELEPDSEFLDVDTVELIRPVFPDGVISIEETATQCMTLTSNGCGYRNLIGSGLTEPWKCPLLRLASEYSGVCRVRGRVGSGCVLHCGE